jgi:hypothetical protein
MHDSSFSPLLGHVTAGPSFPPIPVADMLRHTVARKLMVAMELVTLTCDPPAPGYDPATALSLVSALHPVLIQAQETLG